MVITGNGSVTDRAAEMDNHPSADPSVIGGWICLVIVVGFVLACCSHFKYYKGQTPTPEPGLASPENRNCFAYESIIPINLVLLALLYREKDPLFHQRAMRCIVRTLRAAVTYTSLLLSVFYLTPLFAIPCCIIIAYITPYAMSLLTDYLAITDPLLRASMDGGTYKTIRGQGNQVFRDCMAHVMLCGLVVAAGEALEIIGQGFSSLYAPLLSGAFNTGENSLRSGATLAAVIPCLNMLQVQTKKTYRKHKRARVVANLPGINVNKVNNEPPRDSASLATIPIVQNDSTYDIGTKIPNRYPSRQSDARVRQAQPASVMDGMIMKVSSLLPFGSSDAKASNAQPGSTYDRRRPSDQQLTPQFGRRRSDAQADEQEFDRSSVVSDY